MTDAALPWGAAGPAPRAAETSVPSARTPGDAAAAAAFMRAFGHEGRLLILCHLRAGECSVAELERLLSSRQPAVSQQLGRLRADGLVEARRDGKQIHYRLADARAARLVALLCEMFGTDD